MLQLRANGAVCGEVCSIGHDIACQLDAGHQSPHAHRDAGGGETTWEPTEQHRLRMRERELLERVDELEDALSDVIDADTDGLVSLPEDMRLALVELYNASERVPQEADGA
jgi:hypothetical protein